MITAGINSVTSHILLFFYWLIIWQAQRVRKLTDYLKSTFCDSIVTVTIDDAI